MILTVSGEAVLGIRPDKRNGTPVYLQIADGIRGLMERGRLRAGTLLPPERVLCEQYGVSRMTLRQAFGVLAREGLIETQRGRGTLVTPKRLDKQQQEMRSFTEEIQSRGGEPSLRLVSLRVQAASDEAQEFFGKSADNRVFEIRRLRFRDGEPLALETVRIPCRLCPNLDRFDLANHSLYKILEENYGLTLTHCVEEISAAQADRSYKKLLGSPGVVLVIQRMTYAANVPVEFGTSIYRADAYSAIVRSVRAQA